MGKMPVRLPSYIAAAALTIHAEGEASEVGSTSGSSTVYYNSVPPGNSFTSITITITKRCLVVVVGVAVVNTSLKIVQIRRGGVNKTIKDAVSPANFAVAGAYAHILYAAEILDPGTYLYYLYNSSGTSAINVFGAALKIVAVDA
jgi:hypothetical protein